MKLTEQEKRNLKQDMKRGMLKVGHKPADIQKAFEKRVSELEAEPKAKSGK